MAPKYPFPSALDPKVNQKKYDRWLNSRAIAHVKRDRRKGNRTATVSAYKVAIHSAVLQSDGHDPYTGERLNWSLIGTYDNAQAKRGGREYKAKFALLPSVDHVRGGLGPARFTICSWRANDAKNDLSYSDFVVLCRRVVEKVHHRRQKGTG